MEPRFNEILRNEVLAITNDIFQPSNSVMYGKEPRYNEPISPVPWHFIKSRFHRTLQMYNFSTYFYTLNLTLPCLSLPTLSLFDQAPVVQKLDSAIHRINLYPVDNAIGFPNTYPLDSDLSSG